MEEYFLISKSAVIAKIENERLKSLKGRLCVGCALSDLQKYIEKLPVYNLKNVLDLILEDYEENVDSETGEHCENWVVDMINDLTVKHCDIVKKCSKDFLAKAKLEADKNENM